MYNDNNTSLNPKLVELMKLYDDGSRPLNLGILDENDNKKSYVYAWFTKDNHYVFYVGKGNGNRYKHILSEINDYEKNHDKYKGARYKEIRDLHGIDCEILIDGLSDYEATLRKFNDYFLAFVKINKNLMKNYKSPRSLKLITEAFFLYIIESVLKVLYNEFHKYFIYFLWRINKMKKLFTNDKFFLAMVLLGTIAGVIYSVVSVVYGVYTIEYAAMILFTHFCTCVLYSSYKKHSKNVMKGMIGAILGMRVLLNIYGITGYTYLVDRIFSAVYLLILIAMFATHFVINSNHHSSPAMIRLNQMLVLLMFITELIWDSCWFSTYSTLPGMTFLISSLIANTARGAVIVCVESRLDAYRLDREAAGWTEEKGYPDGYVHEYEKK